MMQARPAPIRCLDGPLQNPGPKGTAEPVDRRQEDAPSAGPTPCPEPPSASRARPGDADRVRADPMMVIARAKHRVAACRAVQGPGIDHLGPPR